MSRASWLFIFSVLFILIGALHAGEGWLSLFAIVIVDGGLAMMWIACAAMLGLAILRLIPLDMPKSLRLASGAGLGLGLYSLGALALGLLGALHRNTALAFPIVSAAVFVFTHWPLIRGLSFSLLVQRIETWLNTKSTHWWAWLAPVTVLAAATVAASLPPGAMWLVAGDPHPYDVLEYHLEVSREWQENAQIAPLHHNVYCFFPANIEMQYLLLMHIAGNAWKVMYLAHFVTLGYGIISLVAIYAAGRALLPDSLWPLLATAAAASIPWLTMLSSVAYNEAGMVLYVALAIAWIARGFAGWKQSPIAFALAGVMAGLACGVKYTAVPIVAVLFLLILFFPRRIFASDVRAATILTGCATFALGAALSFSPWLLRNWRWTGNPVFPEAMSILGRGHFTAEQQARWERAHSPTQQQRPIVNRISAFGREVLGDQRYGYILFPAVLIALFATRPSVGGLIAAATLLALTIFWIGFTHLQSRFFILGLPLAAIVLSQAPRHHTARLIQISLSVCLIITGCFLTHLILYNELERIPDFRRIIGHQELSQFLARAARDRVQNRTNMALVGDARAFLYSLPISQLHYRTIFDITTLDPTSKDKIIDAWLGPDAARLRKECTIIIDQDEVDRLLATYVLGRPWMSEPEPRALIVIPPQP